MYLPVDVQIVDDWDTENDQEDLECIDEGDVSDLCALSSDKHEHEYEDIGVEPLDYTHTTLQMAQTSSSNSLSTETDADVDMGWPMFHPEPDKKPLETRFLVYAGA